MTDNTQETTEKHFVIFKKEFQRLQSKWELNNWHCVFTHNIASNRASIQTVLENYDVFVNFSKSWASVIIITEELVKQAALHEVIHLLLARLSDNGSSRFISQPEIREAEEELVHKLTRIVKSR